MPGSEMSVTPSPNVAEDAIAELLAQRGPGKTICPSEVARRLAGKGGDWRALMAGVHEAVDTMLGRRDIAISWRGRRLDRRRGAYRIATRRSASREAVSFR